MAPALAARRRVIRLLGDKQAVRILFEDLGPRFADRQGGYTRILQLAGRRLGDAGTQAILEFVGTNDRVPRKASKPDFANQFDQPPTETVALEAEEQSEADATDGAENNPAEKDASEEKETS